jgi:hypothetical protein
LPSEIGLSNELLDHPRLAPVDQDEHFRVAGVEVDEARDEPHAVCIVDSSLELVDEQDDAFAVLPGHLRAGAR